MNVQASFFVGAHFMASVAFSGFAAPRLFISLKRSCVSPEAESISLSEMRYESIIVTQAQVRQYCRILLRVY